LVTKHHKKNVHDCIKRLFVPGLHNREDLASIARHSLQANFIHDPATVLVRDDWAVMIDVKDCAWVFGPFLTTLEIMEESIVRKSMEHIEKAVEQDKA
jgi:hypothetical protein